MNTEAEKIEEMARGIAPCWGDGIAGPKQCDESFTCELHYRLAEALSQTRREAILECESLCLKDSEAGLKVCNDPQHDNRWCSTCEHMKDEADMLAGKIRALKGGGGVGWTF